MKHSKSVLAAILAGVMTASMLPMSALAAEKIVINSTTTAASDSTPVAVDGCYYAVVDMAYADFFYGELNDIPESESTELDTTDKVAAYRETGMYDTVTSATTTKSTRYSTAWYETGVANDETNGEAIGANLYGIQDVQIKISAAVYDAVMAAEAQEGSTLAIVQGYLKDAVYHDTAFTTEYKVLNADGTFSKMITEEGEQKVETDVSLSTNTAWGDYQIDLGTNIQDDATTENLYGIIVTDQEGNHYGMLHSDNTWLQTREFAWAVEDVGEIHGNHIPYQRTDGLKNGNTITQIKYLLKDTADLVVDTNTFVKHRVDTTAVVTESKTTSKGTTVKIAIENAPEDANYIVGSVVKGARHGTAVDPDNYSYNAATGVLTLSADCAGGDDYVVTLTDEKYSDIKISGVSVTKRITVADSSITKVKGNKAFSLKAVTNVADAVLTYTSSDKKVVTVDKNGKVSIKGVGKATITIKAQVTTTDSDGNTATTTEATKTVTVKVNPKASKVSSVKSTKAGRATVKVAKVSGVTGYQIQYSNSKSKIASGKKIKTSSTQKVLKSLKKGKKVYVRVRSYQKVNGTNYYSSWSSAKSVTVKK